MELRELESKLKAGYMNKERAAQIMEKEVIKQQEEVVLHSNYIPSNLGCINSKGDFEGFALQPVLECDQYCSSFLELLCLCSLD